MALKDNLHDGGHLRSAQYRRGTIMGLTIAESFILLAFILLLLLMLWRTEEVEWREKFDDTLRAMEDGARIVEDKFLLNVIEMIENLPPENRDKIVKNAIELSNKYDLDDIMSARNMLRLKERGARLVEKKTLLSLLEAIEKLPPTQREAFVELVSVEGYEKVIEWARIIAPLTKKDYSLAEIENALELADRLERRLAEAEETERQITEDLVQATGKHVRALGGYIDPISGAVTIPDALFLQGSSDITPALASSLDGFCVEWLRALKRHGDSIESVRIEGHASSEWELESSPQTAFLNNMELSQARASNVLERCLILSGNGELGQWGRSKLVAVGRSSSQLVTTSEGQEDRIRSRRVMFRFETDKEYILSIIQEDVQALDSTIKP